MSHDGPYLTFRQSSPDQDKGPATLSTRPAPNDTPPHLDHLTERELFDRLGWFISIRWVAGVGSLLLVLVATYRFDVHIPPEPVVITIVGLFLYNAFFLMLVTDAYRRHRVSRRFIVGCGNGQIICDLIALAVLMHFTGGVENQFLVFFICPLVVASELLSARNAYAHAALGALLINAIAWSEYAGLLPHVHVGRAMGTEIYQNTLSVTKFTVALSSLLFAAVFLHSSIVGRLRQRERQLEEAYGRVARLEESKSFAMRKTSHELRAPLHAVTAMLQAIKAETVGEAHAHLNRFVDRALIRTQSLSRLIEELHRYATLRDAATAIHKQQVDLAEIVDQSVSLFMPLAADKSLQMTVSIHPVRVLGDSEALSEVAGNLIVNAIQYTPAGGEIRVCLDRDPATARLAVSDSGIGIAPSACERIFDEFYRTPEAKKVFHHGTGMGLPIVKRIVQAHGGSIRVESIPGQGATFVVCLPATAALETPPAPDFQSADRP
jgi:signal transduction histidine kinase